MTIRIQGAEELRAKLARMPERALDICGAALTECGEEIMTNSQKEVPVLTGALKNSGRVFGAWGGRTRYARSGLGMMTGQAASSIGGMGGEGAQVTLAYGGTAMKYALVQHERTDLNHPRGGKAHYLSDPAKSYSLGSRLGQFIGKKLERALGRM